MARTRRAVVVGAGAFGLAGALELRRRGWEVDVVERGPVPHPRASSTDVSKIVRPDYGADAFHTDLALRALEAWEGWAPGAGRFHRDGFLLLAGRPFARGGFEADSHRLLVERGVPLERLDADALGRRFPAWRRGRWPEAYFNPLAGWVESGAVVARMAEEGGRMGVRVRPGLAMTGVAEEGGRAVGVRVRPAPGPPGREAPELLDADAVVVAAGAWTPWLVRGLGEVMVSVGQPVVHLRPADPGPWRAPTFPTWAADIARTGWYGFPALPDGRVKIGHHGPGWRGHPGSDVRVPGAHVERLRAFLRDALPGLADAPVAHTRVCFYCDTFDGAFWIDREPSLEGLTVAAGGSGHGFKFAPLLGPAIADAVEGADDGGAFAPFRRRAPGPTRTEDARHTGGS